MSKLNSPGKYDIFSFDDDELSYSLEDIRCVCLTIATDVCNGASLRAYLWSTSDMLLLNENDDDDDDIEVEEPW